MSMQVIWKIKHQKSRISRPENLCTQILLPANGICADPQWPIYQICPLMFRWLYHVKSTWAHSFSAGFIPDLSSTPPRDAGRHISMYVWLTAKNDIYIFSEICFKYSWIFSSFTLLSPCYPLPLSCLSLSLFFLLPSSLLPLSLIFFFFPSLILFLLLILGCGEKSGSMRAHSLSFCFFDLHCQD